MALDQFVVVFWPFRHARLRRRLSYTVLSVACVVIVIQQALEMVSFLLPTKLSPKVVHLIGFAVTTSCILMLLTVYPATAYKLYR